MKKKGSTRDVMLIVVLTFIMGFSSLIAITFMSAINSRMQAASFIPTEAKDMLATSTARMPKWLDGGIILFYILFVILGIFLALLIPTNAMFIPISLIYFIFLTFVAKVTSVIYSRMAASASLSAAAAQLTITGYLMDKLPIFTFVFGIIIIAVMVIKK